MNRYHIPVIGYVIAAMEWQRAYGAYMRQGNAFATKDLNQRYDNTITAFIVTVAFLGIASLVGIPLIQWVCQC